MAIEVEFVKFGWDMSLKAQSRRYLAMNSLWLYDEGEGMNEVNFEGDFNLPLSLERDSSKFQGQLDMEHDSEGYGIEGRDGEKRPKREVVSPNGSKEFGTLLGELCLTWKGDTTIKLRTFSSNHVDVEVMDNDMAFDGSNAKSASVVVVRNASGEILTLRTTFHESFLTEFSTEALACFKGILLGAQLGFESVIVEGDLMTTIKKSKLNTPDKPVIGAIVRAIQ
ncbi:hypothetical protein Gotri_002627 [Gossypium trilobum]|uniref:RNase H type-1 domain-containing protein n=1 Tax=Gossypium trilobum TaxID=34281 RepID=A0A7J9FAY4_9ROSI|nr:hypothetical protein [Gossypium trilobum]